MISHEIRYVKCDTIRLWHLYHGEMHRKDGPARVWSDGLRGWYEYGLRHRKDSPAVLWPDGSVSNYERGKRCLHKS